MLKWRKLRTSIALIDELKENNIWVVGASGDAEMDYSDWDWTQFRRWFWEAKVKVCIV